MKLALNVLLLDIVTGDAMVMRKRNAGFTLIELLIVVAIIGILAAVAIPQFNIYRIRGFNSAAVSDLRNFKTDMEAYFYDHMNYPTLP